MTTMRHAGVALVIEALAAAKVERAALPAALVRVAEVMEGNAAQVTRIPAGSSTRGLEDAVAELRAEAAEFRRTAAQIKGAVERDRQIAEAEAAIDDGPPKALDPKGEE